MNSSIEHLNQLGRQFLTFAWPMLWQSSLLIVLVFAVDLLLTRKIPASVRHALWLVVLVKLLLPPTLALPTGATWWLFPAKPVVKAPATRNYVVTYDNTAPAPVFEPQAIPLVEPPPPELDRAGWALLAAAAVSLTLLAWLLFRWAQVLRLVHRATPAGDDSGPLDEARRLARLRSPLRVKLVPDPMSPAVCGLFRPVILLPRMLAKSLSAPQLRAVLLHEAIHLRRLDIWVNCAQALLQVVYWWHPLVWMANARIRRVREEAVDDAVMLALADDAETYAPTLLEVARLALRRPLLSLGLVGILESRSALRQRVERLLAFRAPRHAGLTLASLLGILAFSAVALPMGQGPARAPKTVPTMLASALLTPKAVQPASNPALGFDWYQGTNSAAPQATTSITNPTATNAPCVVIQAEIYRMPAKNLTQTFPTLSGAGMTVRTTPDYWTLTTLTMPPDPFSEFQASCTKANFDLLSRPRILTASGRPALFNCGNGTNGIEFDCVPIVVDGHVNLAVTGTIIHEQAGQMATNQFQASEPVPNHGGMILVARNPTHQDWANVAVLVHVEILTNPPAASFQPRPAPVTKPQSSIDASQQDSEWLSKMGRLDAQAFPPESANAKSLPAGAQLFMRTFKMNTNVFSANLQRRTGQAASGIPDGLDVVVPTNSITGLFRKVAAGVGVNWLSPPGKHIFYNILLGRLFVKATESDLDKIERILSELNNTNPPSQTQPPPTAQPSGRSAEHPLGQSPPTAAPPPAAAQPSDQIAEHPLGQSSSAPVTSPPATNALSYTSPSRQAIISKLDHIHLDTVSYESLPLVEVLKQLSNQSRLLDPEHQGINFLINNDFHLPHSPGFASPSSGTSATTNSPIDAGTFLIGISNLTNVRLVDVLDAIILVSDHPLKYSVRDFAIVFSPKENGDTPQLFTRTYKVDPHVFYSKLDQPLVPVFGAVQTTPSGVARAFFTNWGVNLDDPPGKSVFFNHRLGYLFVKATEQDLDTIDRALQKLESAEPPQLHIKTRFYEVPKGSFKEFEKFLNATNPSDGTPMGILTSQNEKAARQILQSIPDAETLAEPEVTLLSGRQVQVRATEITWVVTNILFKLGATGPASITPQTNSVEVGPILDLVPYVLADGYTINLAAIPSLKEFGGYKNLEISDAAGMPVMLPQFLTRQIVASANLWDGQTLVLEMPERAPVKLTQPNPSELGTPIIGKALTLAAWTDKELLIFITPTIVDPAGNRVHTDDELPFAKDQIPPQPSQPK